MMMTAGILLGAVFMYLLISTYYGNIYGIVAATLFTYAPYHTVDIYVRGAVGEFWAMAFLPLLVLGLKLSLKEKSFRGILIGSFGLAGIILSHTLLGYVTVMGLVIFILSSIFTARFLTGKKVNPVPAVVLFTGLSLSAFFWLPAITEMRYTDVNRQITGTADYLNHFVCLRQLWDSDWGFGGSAPGCIDGLSFKLGKVHILLALFSVFAWISFRLKKRKIDVPFIWPLIIVAVSVYMLLPQSKPLWSVIPGINYLQYPWRFLTYTVFGISIIASSLVIYGQKPVYRTVIGIISVFICLSVNAKLFLPQYKYLKQPDDFISEKEIRFRVSKISDEYLPPSVIRPNSESDVIGKPLISGEKQLEIQFENVLDTYFRLRLNSPTEQQVSFRQAYFPGWKYYLNGKLTDPRIQDGIPVFRIAVGTTLFEAKFTDTLVRTVGNLVSLATLIIILLIYGKKPDA
jgi:hypothetical protein